jgi:hypothetical protein
MGEMERWLTAASAELGVPAAVLTASSHPVLDLVRDVAHGVNRPAAPLSAFLVGLAAGAAGAAGDSGTAVDADQVLARVARLQALAADWERAADG